ncbi:3-oxoacid CoA-transferase subunit A [Parasphingorhabdus marina DSM 22363]|uniref:3-oxoacid CoA-transferase subunit A n=1 Tax=Parasphingorhabdus marina DSM 22363 TaxID=1123272 RepID=A0A1N6D9X5_9SPHN|nr:CoA transferase subunit A [Parasphingorhabdus marina]SIN67602.1 3-oxoacid CoA-transferase subunit A [Parasphingorhabdus marina DSM 22363]
MKSKIFASPHEALKGICENGMLVACGGFGLCGMPESLIDALCETEVNKLTVVSNNAGIDGIGLAKLIEKGQIAKMISSYVGNNKTFEKAYLNGDIDLEFSPQGTMSERLRAGGAGIPAFYTRTGVGTLVAEGKPHEKFDGETFVQERGIRADLALIRAEIADEEGNLVFRKTARNFNPMMAASGKITIVEVEEIVPAGEIDPDHVHIPGIFVQRIVKSTIPKRIEFVTNREEG